MGTTELPQAWLDDPDAHIDDVVEHMERLHARCGSSDEFVAALKGLFPDLEEKVTRTKVLEAEDHDKDDMSDPDADIAAGRSVFYQSGAEMLASLMASTSDHVVSD